MSELAFSRDEAAVLEVFRTRGIATNAQLAVLTLLPLGAVLEATRRLSDMNLLTDRDPLTLTRQGTEVCAAPLKAMSNSRFAVSASDDTGAPDDTSRIRVKRIPIVSEPMSLAMQDTDQTQPTREVTP